MIVGPLLGRGRTSEVYAVDDDRVLRRVCAGIDTTLEAAALSHVVGHGYPAPRLLEIRGRDMLMERLHGPTMLAALACGEPDVHRAAGILADLLRRLHRGLARRDHRARLLPDRASEAVAAQAAFSAVRSSGHPRVWLEAAASCPMRLR